MRKRNEAVRIRPMIEDDLNAVIAVAAGLRDAPHWPRSGYETAIAPGVWPPRIALVAEGPGRRITGFVVAALVPPEAELESIGVDGEFQRLGVAQALFSKLVEGLRIRRCTRILLEVRPSNQAARAFYAALGFAETARRPAYYSDPVEDAILMRLELADRPVGPSKGTFGL